MHKTFHDTWPARRMDLPSLEGEHEANAGPCTGYKVSAPKVPRNRAPIIKTAEQQRDEERFGLASWRETLIVLGTPAGIFLAGFGVWAYRTWWA